MPSFVLFSAASRSRLRWVFLIALPSVGLGFGVPVRTLPELAAGFRTQLSIAWPIVALLGTVDVYPQRGMSPGA